MKTIRTFALQSQAKIESQTGSDENDYVKVCEQAKEWILLTYSVYIGVLDYQFDEGQITSSHKAIKKKEYRTQRDQKLSKDIKDIESFISFYYECKKDLQEAILFAKQWTAPKYLGRNGIL